MQTSLSIELWISLIASGENLEPKIFVDSNHENGTTHVLLLDLVKNFTETEDDAECLASMKNTLQQAIEMIEREQAKVKEIFWENSNA